MGIHPKVAQWGGIAFIVGNFLFFLNKVNEMSRVFLGKWMADLISGQNVGLIAVGQVALIVGYVAYWQVYAPRVGRLGKNALRLFCGGGIILAVGHLVFTPFAAVEFMFLFVIVGLLGVIVGLMLFGVLNVRQPIVGRWPWLPLATAVMGFVGFFLFSGEQITAVFLLFRTLFALGLMGLGLILALENPQHNTLY